MTDEVRDMIGKALANEPPLGIDYDTVHAAGRRRLARRHVGIIGGTALAVIAVASAAVAIGAPNAGPANGPAVPPPVTSSPSTTPAPSQGCVVPARQGGYSTVSDGEATDAELAESARLTLEFAGFTLPLPPGVSTEPGRVRLCAIDNSWGAEFTLRYPGGERAVFLEVLPRAGQAPGECNTFGGRVSCAIKPLSDGSVIRISQTPAPAPNQPVIVNVDAWRADDTLVRVMETGSEGRQAKPRILDDQALIAIATAPQLKVRFTRAEAPPPEASDRRAAELTAILAEAKVLPPRDMRPGRVPGARADALAFYVSQGGYKLDADLVDATGEGSIFINLSPPRPGAKQPDCAGMTGCDPITLPDKRKAILVRQTHRGISSLSLITTAADGTSVSIDTRNQSVRRMDQSKNAPPPTPTRPEPPLSVDDLIRIASIPGLRW